MVRIAVTGASGFVGSALTAALRARGDEVVRLVRTAPRADDEARWDPATGAIDTARLTGVTAVVHLAGANVAAGRWTEQRKRAIRESRGPATAKLCAELAKLDPVPALVCASAVGFYGDRGDEELTEQSEPGAGFLADVVRDWEKGCEPLAAAGARVVNVRIGLVLGRDGGALAKMLLPFKLGLGGRLGHGRQFMSWITRDDLVRVFEFAIDREDLRGPVNATAPNPVTNREFTKALGRALGRPTILPAPAFALKLLLGEMAEELLLAGQRVVPARLQELGFSFGHTEIEPALRAVLGK